MAIITISCVDATNAGSLVFPGMDTSILRPVDVSYLYGMSRKPAKGRIWKMLKIAKRSVFDQYATFSTLELSGDCQATMELV